MCTVSAELAAQVKKAQHLLLFLRNTIYLSGKEFLLQIPELLAFFLKEP